MREGVKGKKERKERADLGLILGAGLFFLQNSSLAIESDCPGRCVMRYGVV